ncbi:MAG: amino acid adenylation domain-containing protein [Verrucomicrobiales bacterium]|nr:amino acid adenylation domain-containing protein [Verrucomicrobiales bacterium]
MEQALLARHLSRRPEALPVKQATLDLSSGVDIDKLRSGLERVAGAFPELKSVFEWPENKEPIRRVSPDAPVLFEVRNLAGDNDIDRATAFQAFLAEESRRPFDPWKGPLWRCALVRNGDWARVVLTLDSLLLDEASLAAVVLALGATLESGVETSTEVRARVISALGISFGDDYNFPSKDAASVPDLWAKYLAGCGSPTPLPMAARASEWEGSVSGTDRGRVEVCLEAELGRGIDELATRLNVRVRTVYEACWGVVIRRFEGGDDLLFAAAREVQLVGGGRGVGQFQTIVPWRAPVSLGVSCHAWIQELDRSTSEVEGGLGAALTEILDWGRVPVRAEGFPMLLDLDPALGVEDLGVWGLRKVDYLERTGFALTLAVRPLERRMIDLNFDRRVLDTETAERLMSLWVRLLASVVSHGDAVGIDALPWMTPAEAAEVGRRSAGQVVEGAVNLGLVAQIERQAHQWPGNAAARFEGRTLTYEALWRRSGRVAARLGKLGVGAGEPVPICAERSFDLLAGILGILRAGAAYVPLDPAYPASRLAMMLEDLRPRVMVTQARLAGTLPKSDAALLMLDEVEGAEEQGGSEVVPRTSESLVYVIFTSGSTGRPKGVAMPEGALVNLLAWQQRVLPMGPGERTLQFAALSFDVSFQEIFSTWTAGATLVLITESLRRDPVALWELMVREQVHRVYLPFVGLQQMAEMMEAPVAERSVLREVITAGEQLRMTPQLRRMMATLKEARLHNHYGPTESHVVTAWTLRREIEPWPALPPIGQPIDHSAVYLLNPRRELVPDGVPGELYLGGACLAAGYLGNERLTADRFVVVDLPGVGAVRLYRTGDMGRRRSDGNLEFLGRADDQVKIRGHRLELGEVEHVLGCQTGVGACSVAARDHQGQKRLVAYFVPASGADGVALSTELRERLKGVLPDYLVPSVFVPLATLPLTPSGKVNRAALPAPQEASTAASSAAFGSADPVLRQIAAVWSEVLGTSDFGLNDNFFELGGSSLMVVRVHRRFKEVHGRDIPIPRLFEHPTLGSLARYLSSQSSTSVNRQAQVLARAALQRAARPQRPPVPARKSPSS